MTNSPPPDDTPDAARAALAEFIRRQRSRLSPEDAGLHGGGRRRVPGLRREELAELSGLSTSWITWLEQARPVAPSSAALDRLAQALRLNAAERAYLFELARRQDPAEPMAPVAGGDAIRRCVDHVTAPAYVLDGRWDVLACNAAARTLFLDWGRSATSEQGAPAVDNLLRFVFRSPDARELIADWDRRAQRLVAEFRSDCARRLHTAPVRSLVDELQAHSADFARLWPLNDVLQREGGERHFRHPQLGALVFEQITLRPESQRDTKLVMLLPAARAAG